MKKQLILCLAIMLVLLPMISAESNFPTIYLGPHNESCKTINNNYFNTYEIYSGIEKGSMIGMLLITAAGAFTLGYFARASE